MDRFARWDQEQQTLIQYFTFRVNFLCDNCKCVVLEGVKGKNNARTAESGRRWTEDVPVKVFSLCLVSVTSLAMSCRHMELERDIHQARKKLQVCPVNDVLFQDLNLSL